MVIHKNSASFISNHFIVHVLVKLELEDLERSVDRTLAPCHSLHIDDPLGSSADCFPRP